MNLTESFLTALDSLLANKLRAVLTMLGVIIGVAAVIALVSLGNGVNASVTGEIQAIGSNLIYVTTDFDNSDGYQALSVSDMEALADPLNVPALSAVSAGVQGTQEVVFGGNASRVTVSGVTANYFVVNNLEDFAAGDGLTQTDLDTQARVAVLGAEIATDLFEDAYPVGNSVKINGVSYTVVGVLAESGSAFSDTDQNVFIPLTTAQSRLYPSRTRSGEKAVSTIIAQSSTADNSDAAMEQITDVLRMHHDIAYTSEDDFRLLSQADLLSTIDTVTATLTAFLGAIAGISLVVGGIGIMNIMLVSVTERTREIGIRKAIGALKRDILAQFLLESVLLSVIGGVLGILLGWSISVVAGNALDLEAVLDAGTILLATGFAAGVGLVFGVYPAWRAAGLRPIEALRYE
ncbi:MAG: ABC transporter permease [Ardenticatenaceae bacterium]|nr:ABC transporter permease [Anaerolineales bacterium]MCB8920065.1 ABC transporter permease [Ardenticatenaceae bacterium]